MCPQCRAFITNKDRVCPYCGEKVGPRAIDLRNSGEMLMGFIPNASFVTVMILSIDVALFAGSFWGGGGLNQAGAEHGFEVLRLHQWYRFVTAGYLHWNFFHIAMNAYALFIVGVQVEELYGAPRFIVFFTVSSVLGYFATAFFSPMVASVGSSAGIMGLIGAMIALGMRSNTPMGHAIRGTYIRWAVSGLLFGLLPGINNIAHLGGLAGGFAVAYVAGTPRLLVSAGELFWRAAAGICVVVTIFCFYQLYLHIPSISQ